MTSSGAVQKEQPLEKNEKNKGCPIRLKMGTDTKNITRNSKIMVPETKNQRAVQKERTKMKN